jgi:hypothetical protein
MYLNRTHANAEVKGDDLVRVTRHKSLENFAFPGAEGRNQSRCLCYYAALV